MSKKRVLALVLSLAMMVSGITVYSSPEIVKAATSAPTTTEGIDDPVEETVHAVVSFEHFPTHQFITLSGTNDGPIDCNTKCNVNNVPQNGTFTTYYGTFNDKEVVNFTNPISKTSWKADNDKVFQIGQRTNPGGWESIQIEPQGDGTICFKSSANDKYVTIKDDKLGLSDFKEHSKVSPNEKFIMHTTTAPKTAKKVKVSSIAGDSAVISWDGVSECLYSGYEVLYSKSENGNYISAGKTADLSLTVENLELNTTYYFKVRTLTNNSDGAYADSKICYATTLRSLKPKTPTDLTVAKTGEGMKLTWTKSAGSVGYKIFRSSSRFGSYTQIGTSTTNSYVDTTASKFKYENYYKVAGTSEDDQSPLSEPTSLEIAMFGKDTYVLSPADDVKQIHDVTNKIFEQQHYSQFGDNRYAFMFKTGDYTKMDVTEIGYYTQILGLGKVPTDVKLNNVKTPAALSDNNATCNFWVGIENVQIVDLDHNGDQYFNFMWGVSQAAPARRLYVERTGQFDWWNGWASGGYVADSYFEKQAGSYSQQQYYYRNDNIQGGVYGVNWNMVVQGCSGVTKQNSSDNSGKAWANSVNLKKNNGYTNWDQRGCSTVINNVERIREKPFLYYDEDTGKYKVFVPALRENAVGTSWNQNSMGNGQILDVEKSFYIANSKRDTADTINKQLEAGKNIILSPGVYHVNKPIRVKNPNTIVLGLGEASIVPENSEAGIITADESGISICGIILDAGPKSKTLLTVGEEGCNKGHKANPIVLQDVIYRVGGTGTLATTESCVVVNSNDTIIDHTWIWRADHGDNTGWNANTVKNGLVVNGNDVIAYGLFVEHFQEYDILWRGENGKTYFLQNEKCYDPQNQAGWMSHNGTKKGYAAYKVTDNVNKHYAVGLGVYDVFIYTNGASIYCDNAIEVPNKSDVLIENACIVEIASGSGPQVGINHIVNNTTAGIRTGAGSGGGYAIQRLLSYCNEESTSLPDYYANQNNVTPSKEKGETPTIDKTAEKDITKDKFVEDTSTKPIWEMTDKDYEDRITKIPDDDNGGNNGGDNGGNNGGSQTITSKSSLKVGQSITVGKYVYKVTSVKGKKGTAKLKKIAKKYVKKMKKAKKIKIAASIKKNGCTLKVTAINKKVFAKCKKVKKFIVKGKNLKKVPKNIFSKKVAKKVKISAKKKVKKIILKAFKRKK